ncbi:hypothetical protein ABZ747_34575 [Kitasatospora cineracea]|uniref:hypothetical protein n=1 Tax=Kitasatospora cineracea TaxID=88074 RepID=UPI0033EDC25A
MGEPTFTNEMATGGSGGGDAVVELSHRLSCIGPTRGDIVDWKAVEAAYGKQLPSDYRQFIDTFGRGSIEQQWVDICGPASGSAEWEGMRVDTLPPEMLQGTADDWNLPEQKGLYRVEDMLVWGITEADVLTWVAVGPDPDRWPVAVWARQHSAWTVYPVGMAEFLVRLLRDEFEEWPLSDVSFRGASTARFLHEDDEDPDADLGSGPCN